jgi:hypothetical protein
MEQNPDAPGFTEHAAMESSTLVLPSVDKPVEVEGYHLATPF